MYVHWKWNWIPYSSKNFYQLVMKHSINICEKLYWWVFDVKESLKIVDGTCWILLIQG